MKFIETDLVGAYLAEQERHGDERGFFARQYCANECAEHGLPSKLVQVNNSYSATKHTIRGLHYQMPPATEAKLVRCVAGSLYNAIVDLRRDSPTFLKGFGVELSAKNRLMLCVPKGCAQSFLTLEDHTEALYFVDEFYQPGVERGMRWDDPSCPIDWPAKPAVVSEKDSSWPDFDPQKDGIEGLLSK